MWLESLLYIVLHIFKGESTGPKEYSSCLKELSWKCANIEIHKRQERKNVDIWIIFPCWLCLDINLHSTCFCDNVESTSVPFRTQIVDFCTWNVWVCLGHCNVQRVRMGWSTHFLGSAINCFTLPPKSWFKRNWILPSSIQGVFPLK